MTQPEISEPLEAARTGHFEVPCFACLGHPDHSAIDTGCEYCGGKGHTPTPLGVELLQFLARRGFRPRDIFDLF